MEDLIPLLIFIVIAAVNFLKYMAEKGGKKAPPKSDQEAPEREPSSLEDFFEEIARKFEPKPTEMPEWPEDIPRPDYLREMQDYEPAPVAQPASTAPSMPEPQAEPLPATPALVRREMPRAQAAAGAASTFKIPTAGTLLPGLGDVRIAMPPMLRSATGHTRFELNQRHQLKRAMIASLVFGPPRAYDTTFDTTVSK